MASTKLPSNPQCAICSSTSNLSRCAGCLVAHYCSREHQTSDWPAHQSICKSIKTSRAKFQREEAELRSGNARGFLGNASRPFEDGIGHFWGLTETRAYMRARFAHVMALLAIENASAVQASLDHLLDMLRLCRSDNLGIRDTVPGLYLRLGKLQDCYDFLKWWTVTGENGDYDWGNVSLPYLDYHGEDVLEDVKLFTRNNSFTLGVLVPLTLLKIQLLLELRSVRDAILLGKKVPQELLDTIRSKMLSPALTSKSDLMSDVVNGRNLEHYIESLEKDVDSLFGSVDSQNHFMWNAIVKPYNHLEAQPEAMGSGTREEMQSMLKATYNAWKETPEAVAMIDAKCTELKSDPKHWRAKASKIFGSSPKSQGWMQLFGHVTGINEDEDDEDDDDEFAHSDDEDSDENDFLRDLERDPASHVADYKFTEEQLDWIEDHYRHSGNFMTSHGLRPFDDEDCEDGIALVKQLMAASGDD